MTSLRDIRKRIRSVANIKQITKTMEMVAGVRLRKAQSQVEQAVHYAETIKRLFDQCELPDKHPLLKQKKGSKIGLVVIAADRGLSGAYNTTLFSTADKFLRQHAESQVELILAGRKAVEHYQRSKQKVHRQLPKWGGTITLSEMKAFANALLQDFLADTFDEVWIIYTHYISLAKRHVVIEKILPFVKTQVTSPIKKEYIYEPDQEAFFAELAPRYFFSKIHMAFLESYASELIARVFSMREATKNADEMILNLTLVRNKVRQASITKEMLEITAGAILQ